MKMVSMFGYFSPKEKPADATKRSVRLRHASLPAARAQYGVFPVARNLPKFPAWSGIALN